MASYAVKGAPLAASVASGAGSKACVGVLGRAAAAAGVALVSSPVAARLPPLTALLGHAQRAAARQTLLPGCCRRLSPLDMSISPVPRPLGWRADQASLHVSTTLTTPASAIAAAPWLTSTRAAAL